MLSRTNYLVTPSYCNNNNNNNNNGPNGHLLYVGGDLMMRRSMLPIIMLPHWDLRIVLHLVPFWILTIWGSVHMRKPWYSGVTNFGWKPPLHNSRNFISQRSTSHATQSFITPVEPQLPRSCMIQLLAGIISLRRVLEANPGHSHGSADSLPLCHSANLT